MEAGTTMKLTIEHVQIKEAIEDFARKIFKNEITVTSVSEVNQSRGSYGDVATFEIIFEFAPQPINLEEFNKP